MRLVARRAAQPERRLMQMRLLELLRLIAVAGQASVDRVRLNESRRLAGMRIVAGHAIALRARMLHFGLVDLFGLVAMAGNAQRFGIGLRQHHLAVLRGSMTAVASSHRKRRMGE